MMIDLVEVGAEKRRVEVEVAEEADLAPPAL